MHRVIILFLMLLAAAIGFGIASVFLGGFLWLRDLVASFGVIAAAILIFIFSLLEFKFVWRGDKRFIIADAMAPISFGLFAGMFIGLYF